LMLLGVLFFFLEVKLTSHGLFAVGGAIAMILGAVLLFHRNELAPKGELWFVIAASSLSAAVLAALSLKALSMKRLPERTGAGALIGQVVEARTAIAPRGKVFADGDLWDARSYAPV